MNKLKRLSSVAVIFVFLFSSGCKKSDNSTPPLTNTDHLISGSWKFSMATASGVDVTSQIPACFKDNTIVFIAGGNGNITEGTDICSPTTAGPFTWAFQNNETQLNLSAPLISGGSGLFDVVMLNEVSLKLSQDMIIPPSMTPVNVIISFTH